MSGEVLVRAADVTRTFGLGDPTVPVHYGLVNVDTPGGARPPKCMSGHGTSHRGILLSAHVPRTADARGIA